LRPATRRTGAASGPPAETRTRAQLVAAIERAASAVAGRPVEVEDAVRRTVDRHRHQTSLAVQGGRDEIEVWEPSGAAPFLAVDVATGTVFGGPGGRRKTAEQLDREIEEGLPPPRRPSSAAMSPAARSRRSH
jgi:hypothetical protein